MAKSNPGEHEPKEPGTESGLNRRNFISGAAGIAAGATGLSALGSSSASGSDVETQDSRWDFDVVVIGAGFAGVTAARDVRKAGLSCTVLEARNRIGGRTFSTEFEGAPIELGGTWVHNTQPFVWTEMQRYGVPVLETPGAVAEDLRLLMPDGELLQLNLAQVEEVAIGWQTYCALGRELLPRPYDLLHNRDAVLQADRIGAMEHLATLDLNPLQRAFIETLISVFASNHASEMAYLEVLRFHILGGDYFPTLMDATTRFQPEGGTRRLIEAIAGDAPFDLKLSSAVKSVASGDDGVVVTTTRGEKLTCGTVITTIPMNTLGRIEFTPALPAGVIEAGKAGHVGAGMKMYLKVKGDLGNFAAFAPNRPMNYAMTYKRGKDYTLVVAFYNPDDNIDPYDEESLQEALRHYVPGAEVLSVMHYDWNSDPYSSGTWATYRKGWVARYYDEFQRDNGRLLFASGDHGEGWRGTIDGAIGAGTIAARKAIELLA